MTADSPSPDPQMPETTSPASPTPSTEQPPSFGWNAYAERLNGRFAMIGFVALLTLEVVTHQTFFSWIGLF